MSDAKKCDRCGAYYTHKRQEFHGIRQAGVFNPEIEIDLCPKCYEDLCRFVNGAEFDEATLIQDGKFVRICDYFREHHMMHAEECPNAWNVYIHSIKDTDLVNAGYEEIKAVIEQEEQETEAQENAEYSES